MPQECIKCKIVWSDATIAAHSPQRGYTEEVIEVCPKCHSSLDLIDSNSTNTYYMSFTGKIISDLTGEELKPIIAIPKRKEAANPYVEPVRRFSIADGSNCLYCEENKPKHKSHCPQYKITIHDNNLKIIEKL